VYWRSTRVEDHILVDKSLGDRQVEIEIELHFHALPCSGAWTFLQLPSPSLPPPCPLPWGPLICDFCISSPLPGIPLLRPACAEVNLVSEDSKGSQYDESQSSLVRLDTSPGCVLKGVVRVKGLPGHLHVSAQRSMGGFDGRMQFAIDPASARTFNASHTFRRLSFGPAFPGQVSPLDGVSSVPTEGPAAFQYHLRVVPTVYERLHGPPIDSRQYSASDFVQEYDARSAPNVHPGLWLRYDFSPTMVRRVEVRRTFLQFLTSLCAILGGVFTISGLVDQCIYRTTSNKRED